MHTSTVAGGLMALKWMLKPCAKNSALPSRKPGRISDSYTARCLVSGNKIMMTSASSAASRTLLTVKPSARARSPDGEPS